MEELRKYIRTLRDKGLPDTTIRTKLVSAGWDVRDVNQELHPADDDIPPPPPPPSVHAKQSGYANMWEGFEHVLMFLSLYFMAGALGLLLHEFINKWSPESANTFVNPGIIRGAIATLIVTFPLFAYFYLDILKRSDRNPAIKQLHARRFFTYLTLVGTFIFGVYKTVQTILAFLDGNVTPNFLLHLVVTLSIIGLIFYRYLVEVKEDRRATV